MKKPSFVLVCLLAGVCMALANVVWAEGSAYVWTGAAGSDWFDAGNWSPPGGPPGAGDTASCGGAGFAPVLTNATPPLAAFEMSGGTMTFSNWFARLEAGAVSITGGTLALPPAFTVAQMSNRVWIVCSNLFLGAAGTIDADARGYAGAQGPGKGTNGGAAPSTGAGHGASGGMAFDGVVDQGYLFGGGSYGSTTTPETPGSGSGSTMYRSGEPGGGVVRIEASGLVLLNGTVTANGADGVFGSQYRSTGGASGGAVWISCTTFAGTNGVVRANGGAGVTGTYVDAGLALTKSSGGGSGGRIAINYDPLAQGSMPKPSVAFSVNPGRAGTYHPDSAPSTLLNAAYSSYIDRAYESGWGTLYFRDASGIFSVAETVSDLSGHVTFGDSATNFSLASLSLERAYLGIDADAVIMIAGHLSAATNAGLIARRKLNLTVGGDVVLRGETRFDDAVVLDVKGKLTVRDRGEFSLQPGSRVGVGNGLTVTGDTVNVLWKGVEAAVTGGVRIANGSWLALLGSGAAGSGSTTVLDVAGDLVIESNAWLYVHADPKLGGAPWIHCSNLAVDHGGGICGDARGYAALAGPGHGGNGSPGGGGGHGGAGGAASGGAAGGVENDDAAWPAQPGSTGGWPISFLPGQGGALVRLRARGAARIDGRFSVDGQRPYGTISNGRVGGGGAGGGLLLVSKGRITGGASARLLAQGGGGVTNATYGAGGGGGGRIAVYTGIPDDETFARLAGGDRTGIEETTYIRGFSGTWSVGGGEGYRTGADGSARFFRIAPPIGSKLLIR